MKDLQLSFSLFHLACLTFLLYFSIFFLFKYLLIKTWSSTTTTKNVKLPPGPWKLPLIGHIHHLVGKPPHHALRDLARKHGPLMHLKLGEISAIVISSPQLAKEVFNKHDLAISDRFVSNNVKLLFNGGDIAFASYGDYWRQIRRIAVLDLLSKKNVQSFCSIREEEICNLVASINLSLGSPINLSVKLLGLTSSITMRSAFGKCIKQDDAFTTLIHEAMDGIAALEPTDLFPSLGFLIQTISSWRKHKMVQLREEGNKIMEEIINERKRYTFSEKDDNETEGEENILDVLLRLQSNYNDLEFPITNDNILAVILELFLAGSDSSALVTDWALVELMRKPKLMAKAQREVRDALKGKKTVSEVDIQGLIYLKLVIKETLRLHTPGPLLFPRQSRESFEFEGLTIPSKTMVVINAWAIGRDPAYWDNAETFIPERFEHNSIDFTGNFFEYIPFGAGRRICPGITFGLATVELALAQLLYHFDWTIFPIKPEEIDISESNIFICKRIDDLCMIATPYDPSFDG